MNKPAQPHYRLLALLSDRLTVALVSELLADTPVEIVLAGDRKELLRMARSHPPDVVLLNYENRDSTGLVTCQDIRNDPLLADLPVLMITARDDRESRLAAIEAGADDFIIKPFDIDDMELRLQAILRALRFRKMLAVQRQFEVLAEQAPNGIVMVNNRHRVQFANAAARRLLDLDTTSRLPWPEQLGQRFLRRPEAEWASLGSGNLPSQLLLLERPGTTTQVPRWFSCTLRQLPDDPEMHYMVSMNEITSAVQQQRVLWTVKTLIMHKLRTPINGMLPPAQMLVDSDLPQEEKELASIILESGNRLVDMLTDIERYFDEVPRGVAHTCTVARMVELLPEIARQQGVTNPVVTLFTDNPQSLPMDEPTVRSVLGELLRNARKFHPSRKPFVQIFVSHTAMHGLRVEVVDDGVRLPPDQLSRLHVPFYQAEDHPTGELVGAGLGLSQVARIVWEAGGQLGFSNRGDAPGLCVRLDFNPRERLRARSSTTVAKAPHGSWEI